MVAFRKLFPVLAIMALLLGTALTANAQIATGQPLSCVANSGVPPIVRAEGYTELTGDLVIECTGGDPTATFLANFQIFLNTNITSRLVGDATEALLMIDEPGVARRNAAGTGPGPVTPFCVSPVGGQSVVYPAGVCPTTDATASYQTNTYTVFRGQRGNQPNQTIGGVPVGNENILVWAGIPVVPPGSNRTRVFRFTNIRANAAGIGVAQTFTPNAIFAYVSVFPQNTLPINNPQQIVGYVQQGMVFSVTNCTGAAGASDTSNNQCQSRPSSGDPVANLGLTFREGFQTAFKPRLATGQESGLPGSVFNSESGFVRTAAGTDGSVLGSTVGVADTGTRLAARFVNVPTGVRVFVATANNGYVAATTTTGPVGAVLVLTDPSGASVSVGGTTLPSLSGTSTIGCGSGTTSAVEVPLTSGSGLAVWEVVGSSPTAIDQLTFPMAYSYTANVNAASPALGTATVIGNLAPFYAAGTAERMNAGLPIPRFATRSTANNLFTINQCVTNLLFPFVTNRDTFDTGIAIANTSTDPFSGNSGRMQGGRCTIYYYGTLANGNAPTPNSEQTDRDVPAGATLTFILSGGGTYGLKGSPGFQGYMIAQCGFLYAHGFAFITDGPIGQARVAEGYLALVLTNVISGPGRNSTTYSEVLAH